MRRLSIKQNDLLEELREQAERIENLSKVEHDLIKEVHSQAGCSRSDYRCAVDGARSSNCGPAAPRSKNCRFQSCFRSDALADARHHFQRHVPATGRATGAVAE